VFNNPFGSFHNTVAEAKEEREQLDRLLTISTPRERLLVAAIGLLLFALTGWLLFGDVAHSRAVHGVLADPGGILTEGSTSVQALVQVERDLAPQVRSGMPAVLVLTTEDGEDTLDGKVTAISAVPLSGGLAAFGSAVAVYRVDIALDESVDLASLTDRECRIVIELGRQSPVQLLRMRRS